MSITPWNSKFSSHLGSSVVFVCWQRQGFRVSMALVGFTFSLFLSNTHTHTHKYTHSLSLSVSHSHTHTHSPPTPTNRGHSQFIRTVVWLCYSVAFLQIGGHFKGVDVCVGLLSQSHHLPQRHAKRPLVPKQTHIFTL